jgi:branched-chain amino acid transport system permease protein
MVIGLVEELSSYPLFSDQPLISPGYQTGVAFALMIIMLIWRPQGLLRGRVL